MVALYAVFSFKFRIPKSLPTGRQAHSALEWANFFMDDTLYFKNSVLVFFKKIYPHLLD